ncbi:hypothetical protein SCE1572_12355 [Sorangium cellulosum So0157-2]|uniref:Uncharacterized protein n=1 Tax=Sorangium cellulosum So0157-2 TaxID=1254432 RepID=S4XPW0_SORCE|nr:hypothetical protein SCE1572_12355 [Sorangium cellulosum So0157-2]
MAPQARTAPQRRQPGRRRPERRRGAVSDPFARALSAPAR